MFCIFYCNFLKGSLRWEIFLKCSRVYLPCSNFYETQSNGEENGNPLQYSCLEKSMDRGVWRAEVHGIT